MDINTVALLVCGTFAAVGWAYAAGQHHANKRPINVHQEQHNHAAPVSVVTSGGESAYPKLIGGLLILLVIGAIAAAVLSGLSQLASSVDNGLRQITAPKAVPTVAPTLAPTADPTARPIDRPVYQPSYQPVQVQTAAGVSAGAVIAMAALAVTAVGLWASIGVMAWRKRTIKRPNVITATKASPGYTHPAFDAAAKNVNARRL